MAVRPVFVAKKENPFYSVHDVEFKFHAGFAPCQKQKNILAIHEEYLNHFPNSNVLEISTKSLQIEGCQLSAFTLKKFVPSIGKSVPVENIYQASKLFSNGQQYVDLFMVSPRQAKKDVRLIESGNIIGYCFEGQTIPLDYPYEFYHWIYISALLENSELAQILLKYDAFTDIEFCPSSSINCQARAAAIYVSLVKQNKLKSKDKLTYEQYCQLVV